MAFVLLAQRRAKVGDPVPRIAGAAGRTGGATSYRSAGSGRPISSVKPAPSLGTSFCTRPWTLSAP